VSNSFSYYIKKERMREDGNFTWWNGGPPKRMSGILRGGMECMGALRGDGGVLRDLWRYVVPLAHLGGPLWFEG
jgi:hypothetical protein